MRDFVVKRIATAVALVMVVSCLSFVMTWLTPGDPAQAILGQTATPEQVAAKRVELGLDQDALTAYLGWLGGAVTGDLG
ncbi:MAG: ABC transporter permease, partial [Bifidobacteriaceae bacterium]|nr:ABC transporter permease [Bifidobacteriaceae bacterium]